MERYRYIAKRLLTAIPTFLGITILVYVVASPGAQLAVGNPVYRPLCQLQRRWQGRVRNWDWTSRLSSSNIRWLV